MQISYNRFTAPQTRATSKGGGVPQGKTQAVLRDVAIDTAVAGLAATAGWGLSRVNPLLGLGAGAVIGFVAPRPAHSPYAQDGVLARPAGALLGTLCAAAGTFAGPLAIPIAAGFGAFRGAAGHALYPNAS